MFKCEFCGVECSTQGKVNIHKARTKSCIEIQIKKLGRPLSEINKEKRDKEEAIKKAKEEANKAKEEAKKAKEEAKKSKEEAIKKAKEEAKKVENKKDNIVEQSETSTDEESEEEIDEDAELPFSSSDEDESSNDEETKEEPAIVKEVFDKIEEYQRKNPSRLNNLFKRKSSTVKTEIITDDQPPEVHKRKIEEYLPSKEIEKSFGKELNSSVNEKLSEKKYNDEFQKEISKLIEDKILHLENKFIKSINNLDIKMNSILEVMGKMEGINDKRLKSIENKLERGNISVKDVEKVIDNKLDDMFTITSKMLAEVESKSELLDIFRENMEDIVDKHYDLYKKFKYVKEDIEDMVYDKRR